MTDTRPGETRALLTLVDGEPVFEALALEGLIATGRGRASGGQRDLGGRREG